MAIPKLIRYGENFFIKSQGTLLEGFETFADWTLTGGGCSLSADSTHKKEGIQSLRVNSVNGVQANAIKTISEDFSAVTNFVIWVYVDDDIDLSNLSFTSFCFSSTADWSKNFHININSDHHKHGWNRFVVHKAAFTNIGEESWDNTMIRMRVRCEAQAGKNVSVCFDDLRYDHSATPGIGPTCILCFDDNSESVYTKAYPIMAANTQFGVAFIITDNVGIGGRMTKAQMTTLQSAGWDISNHSKTHYYLSDITQVAMENQIDGGYDWLVNNGFINGARFFAYPYGDYNQAVINKVKERHRIARSTIKGAYQPHFEMLDNDIDLLVKARQVTASDSPATVQGWIDDTIVQQGLLVLLFHIIVDSGATGELEYNKADFETIADYLLSKSAQIGVRTLSKYYEDSFLPLVYSEEQKVAVVYLQHGAILPYPIDYDLSESVGRAEDGRLKVYKHPLAGDRKRIWRIKCVMDNSASSGYKWRDLEYFYSKVVEGAKQRCVFVDANSVQYVVRITGFAPRAIGLNNRHEITMILEEDYS